ncbi:hypothetical protein BHM03_00045237 [Ensete ventricosum]|nr:hypothetical protein BHM03_00045237 [Ensete ventricosum]
MDRQSQVPVPAADQNDQRRLLHLLYEAAPVSYQPQSYASTPLSYFTCPNPNPSAADAAAGVNPFDVRDHRIATPYAMPVAGGIGLAPYYNIAGGQVQEFPALPFHVDPSSYGPVSCPLSSSHFFELEPFINLLLWVGLRFIRGAIDTKVKVKDLETKKSKVIEGGAAAESVKICTVCNVVCNSDKVFASHLAGEKHANKMKATGIIPKVKDVETKKSKVIQGGAAAESVRICKLCNVVCNSDKVFASHLAGEKHIMKVNRCSTVLEYILVCMSATGTKTKFKDLETKKSKVIQGGVAAESVRVCTLCDVVCNSDKVFASHLAGEKHIIKHCTLQAQGRLSISPSVVSPSNVKPGNSTNETIFPACTSSLTSVSGTAPWIEQPLYCEICNISCNSEDVLNKHKMGKKHKKNLEKLQETFTEKPTNAQVVDLQMEYAAAFEETENKTGAAFEQDLETKRRKVLEEGAATDAVRGCYLCNVVCNSQKVFDIHIAGQKHKAMVKKQQEILTSKS